MQRVNNKINLFQKSPFITQYNTISGFRLLKSTNLRRFSSKTGEWKGLGNPTWSVKSLLEGKSNETITDETVQHLAWLSRLNVTPEQTQSFRKDIEKMLVFV